MKTLVKYAVGTMAVAVLAVSSVRAGDPPVSLPPKPKPIVTSVVYTAADPGDPGTHGTITVTVDNGNGTTTIIQFPGDPQDPIPPLHLHGAPPPQNTWPVGTRTDTIKTPPVKK